MIQGLFSIHPAIWFLLPTVTVEQAQCECCDNGPVVLSIEWLCFSAGLAFNLSHE